MEPGEYFMRQAVATGSMEELVSHRLNLPEPAMEILEWRKSVNIHEAEAVRGGVIVTGCVRTRCLFTTLERAVRSSDGKVSPPSPPGEAWGRVLYHMADLRFSCYMPVPGATPGMAVVVTAAHVGGEAARPVTDSRTGLITSVLDHNLVAVAIRVSRAEFVPAKVTGERRAKRGDRPPSRRKGRAKDLLADSVTGPWVHPLAKIRSSARDRPISN
jgi:hypothetical protein